MHAYILVKLKGTFDRAARVVLANNLIATEE